MIKRTLFGKWSFKKDILTMYYAFRHHLTPWYAKATSLLSLAYLVSPVDLLPDLVPLAGYVDDLFVVPFLINISTRLLPAQVKNEAAAKAQRRNLWLNVILILLALILVGLIIWFIYLATRPEA